ncbi:MAG TPA: dihydrolipoamide acetyltransferase family protein [Candidatus Binatia bacterium]
MPTDVIMPALGVAQEKGTLLNWLKSEGDSVKKGEPLMEIETDKATVEIEAPASGILANVSAAVGDEVPVGNRIAVILAEGETANTAAAENPPASPFAQGGTTAHPNLARTSSKSERSTLEQVTDWVSPFEKGGSKGDFPQRILASPAARRIASERGIDLSSINGSGPEGAVVASDVLNGSSEAAPVRGATVSKAVPLTPMRRIIGERMTKSKQTAPHFYLSMDADMTEITRARNAAKEKSEPIVPSINDYIIKACAVALREFPLLNAAYTEHGIETHADINIGMAVALDEGLVVPVIRNTDRLTLTDLAQQARDLGQKAQAKKLTPLDYEGGTFTVSNLGMLGVDSFIAIINPPQAAIVAVGQVARRVVPYGEGIAVRHMMTMSISADHRVVDGAMAARFLRSIKKLLEDPHF